MQLRWKTALSMVVVAGVVVLSALAAQNVEARSEEGSRVHSKVEIRDGNCSENPSSSGACAQVKGAILQEGEACLWWEDFCDYYCHPHRFFSFCREDEEGITYAECFCLEF